MKYSFIIPYRDRFSHLNLTVAALSSLYPDDEIIIVEQDDNYKFRRANLLNEGAHFASGDILVFHDVDYYPTREVVYYDEISCPDVFLPVKSVQFVYNDLTAKPIDEIPAGYRKFHEGVDDNFFGGVCSFTREAFAKVNGFGSQYVGWGFEESDLRERTQHYGLTVKRSRVNNFLALDHPDSGPGFTDQDFLNNITKSQQWQRYLERGWYDRPHTSVEVTPKHSLVTKWIKTTNFDGPTNIVISTFNFDEGDE